MQTWPVARAYFWFEAEVLRKRSENFQPTMLDGGIVACVYSHVEINEEVSG